MALSVVVSMSKHSLERLLGVASLQGGALFPNTLRVPSHWLSLTKRLDRPLGDLSLGVSLELEVKSSRNKHSLGERLGLVLDALIDR